MKGSFERWRSLINQSIVYGPPMEAVTGKLNADGSVNQNPKDGLTGPYIWVRIGGSREETRVKALNTRDDWANVPVIVQRNRRTKELELTGVDPIKGPETLGTDAARTFNIPRRVGDLVDELLPGRSFKPGRPTAAGLVVSVAPFPYTDSAGNRKVFPDDVAIAGQSITITAPGSGLQRWTQIYFNPDATTPALGVAYGTAFSLAMPETTNDPQDIALTSGYIALDAVLVKNGDTVLPESRWRFGRQFFRAFGGGIVESIVAGTNITVNNTDPANPIVSASSGPASIGDYILIRDEKAQNTDGGTFSSGAWRTRVLNTEVTDTGNHATLASNQITLAAGTYRCYISAPAFFVDGHQARLYNVTDSAVVLLGTAEYTNNSGADGVTTRSLIIGRFTIGASKALEVQHQCQTTHANVGFGSPANFTTEIFTIVELTKEP